MKESDFFKLDSKLIKISQIAAIQFGVTPGSKVFFAQIHWNDGTSFNVWEQSAIDLAMRFGPQVLEGNPEFKFAKRAWMFHNLVAHPLMQILALFGFTKLGLRIHDATIPIPKVSA